MLALIAIFFATSGVSVITGSTSIITVPAMFQFGIDSRVAVATNMFALTLMSFGGSLPFLVPPVVNRRRLPFLIVLTLFGSASGAFLLLEDFLEGRTGDRFDGDHRCCSFFRTLQTLGYRPVCVAAQPRTRDGRLFRDLHSGDLWRIV